MMGINYYRFGESSLTYHPELGGLISGLVIDGQEILYCDKASLTGGSIRGGIPTMLPNPGAGDGVLPRHGIARTAQFIVSPDKGRGSQIGGVWNNLTLTLDRHQSTITSEQYSLFPYDFVYDLSYEFINHGCIIIQQITNPLSLTQPLSPREDLRMGFGLHPYFPTPLSIQQMIGGVAQDLTISHHHDDTQVVQNLGTIILTYPHYQLIIECSDIYPWIWVWTPPGHHAICIEPVTHDVGQYFINPIIISPGAHVTGTVRFEIEILH